MTLPLIKFLPLLMPWGLIASSWALPQDDELYRTALQEAIRKAQSRLEASLELYEDHSTWETAWRVRSAHYEVRTPRSRRFGVEIAEGLEEMLGHYKLLLAPKNPVTTPFAIHIYPDLASYNQYGENFAEHSSFYGSFYAQGDPELPVVTYYNPNPTLMKMWVTHSAVHQFIDRSFSAQVPTFVDEGLASYFALYWDSAYGARELERIKASGQYVPIRSLLSSPVTQYVQDPHERLIQLGMLFTYLLHFREDTRTVSLSKAPFANYLRDVLNGADFRSSPVHDLLTSRAQELESEFKAYEFAQ